MSDHTPGSRLRPAIAAVMGFFSITYEWIVITVIAALCGALYLISAPFILLRRGWRALELWAIWSGDAAARDRAESYGRWRDS